MENHEASWNNGERDVVGEKDMFNLNTFAKQRYKQRSIIVLIKLIHEAPSEEQYGMFSSDLHNLA